ncbi:hypothetical protein [Nakamurella sp.]|uniref:hypothetical protein n=1 Tax=Nakamurella sp. TaxID=1869182 RepID=UPI003B3B2DEA
MPFNIEVVRQIIRDEVAPEIFSQFQEYYRRTGGGDMLAAFMSWTSQLVKLEQAMKDGFLTRLSEMAHQDAFTYGQRAQQMYALDVHSLEQLDREFQDLVESRLRELVLAEFVSQQSRNDFAITKMVYPDLSTVDGNELKSLLNQVILRTYAGVVRWSVANQQSPWIAIQQFAYIWQEYSEQARNYIYHGLRYHASNRYAQGIVSWPEHQRFLSFTDEFHRDWPGRVQPSLQYCVSEWEKDGFGPPKAGLLEMF